MKYIIIIYLLLKINVVSCQVIALNNINLNDTIRIAPEYLFGGSINDFVSDISYLPLPVIEKNTIDKITKMCTINNLIYLLDIDNGIYIYSKNGEPILHLKNLKMQNKSIRISDLSVFDKKLKIQFYLENKQFSAILGSKGEIINPQIQKNHNILDSIRLGKTVFYARDVKKGSIEKIVLETKDKPLLKLSDSTKVNWNIHSMDYPFSNSFNKIHDSVGYFVSWGDYQIFQLNEKGIQKAIRIILPIESTIDYEKILSLKNNEEYESYLMNNYKVSQGFENIQIYKDYLLLYYRGYPDINIMYNPMSEEFFNLNNLIPSSENDFLPIMSTKGFPYLMSDGEYLFTIIYPYDIFDIIQKLENEGHKVSNLSNKLAKHPNPILVKFKLK